MHDNEIYEKNMAALEQKYPRLASLVRDGDESIYQYEAILSSAGDPNVIVKREQDLLLLYDNKSPLEYCKDYFENLKLNYAPIAVFLGLGLGYHLYWFIKEHANRSQTKKIIVFEEDIGLLRLAMQTVDLTYLISHPDIYIFAGNEFERTALEMRKKVIQDGATYFYMRAAKIIPLPSHVILNRQYCLKAVETLKKMFSHTVFLAGNDPTDCFVGLDNLLMNVKHIVSNPGINLLFDKFKGKPAVTVASGPSLSKNMHLLRDIGDKALIVCCDASLVPLMKQNIRPHIVVTMERTEGTYHFFDQVADFEDIYLATFPLVRPSVFDKFKGRKFIVHRPFSHFDWLRQDKGTLSTGPSVGNMAFKVAETLGCDPVIVIGQDLALAEGGATHVKELVFGERLEMYYENVFEVEGIDGKPVTTHRDWNLFRTCFEEDLDTYPGVCVDATEGGAKIRGTRIMTFREAINNYCREEFSPLAIIEETIAGFDGHLDSNKELEKYLPRIKASRTALEDQIKELKKFRDETCKVQKEMISPFMYQGARVDREILMEIVEKYLDLLSTFFKDKNIKDLLLYTLQPYIMWSNNKMNFLPEIYTDEDCLHSAQVLMIKEWLGVVGQFAVSTVDILNRTEAALTK